MRPTVERYQYNLWGVLEIKSHGELNQEELEVIKREWAGQACDGWGECFHRKVSSVSRTVICMSILAILNSVYRRNRN